MAEGGPKLKNQWGSNKIEVVPISLGNPHVHLEIQIQKNNVVPPPYHIEVYFYGYLCGLYLMGLQLELHKET